MKHAPKSDWCKECTKKSKDKQVLDSRGKENVTAVDEENENRKDDKSMYKNLLCALQKP